VLVSLFIIVNVITSLVYFIRFRVDWGQLLINLRLVINDYVSHS